MNRAGLLLCLCATVAQAQDGWDDDDDDFGEAAAPVAPVVASRLPKGMTIHAMFRSDWGLRVERADDAPWAVGRQTIGRAFEYKRGGCRVKLAGRWSYDLAYLSADADAPTEDAYRHRLFMDEQYVACALGAVELTAGRQIVAWGEGDLLSPLDVVNPRDQREPGLAELDELRLATIATRVGWFYGDHRLEVMVLHEANYGERPPPAGEFSPFAAVLDEPMLDAVLADKTLRYHDEQARFDTHNQGYLARWIYKGPGVDLGFYAASVLDRAGTLSLPSLADLTGDTVRLHLDHGRYELVGHSGAYAAGTWLLKWEVVAELDKAMNVGDLDAAIPVVEVDEGSVVTGMAGLTWRGIAETAVSVEAQRGVLVDGPGAVLVPPDMTVAAFRVSHDAMGQRLNLQGVGMVFGVDPQRGWLARAEASYVLRDGLKLGVGAITYQPTDEFGPIAGFYEHDRVFGRLRWDFEVE